MGCDLLSLILFGLARGSDFRLIFGSICAPVEEVSVVGLHELMARKLSYLLFIFDKEGP